MTADHPSSLGRYEILQELGRGAMGVVYLAWDPLIGRSVAIKTFRSVMADDDPDLREFRARFIREAQSAGILSHPNIVTIHDVVEGREGSPSFIAMEYVEGTDLREVLRHGRRLSVPEMVETISQVASALDYAHAKGVIHRDIKPANIILDRDGKVKITDFGIARLETSDLTQDGQLLGTPNYMAPERIQGGTVDHRTDIFSLGVVLYEMLTGYKPFQGDSLTTVSHRIVYEPFTPLDTLVPGLPEAAVTVISRALAKRPEDRYASAGELAVDLQLAVAPALNFELPPSPDEGTSEEPDSDLSATQDVREQAEVAATGAGERPVSRRFGLRSWVAAGALVMLLLAATVAALWVRWPVAEEPAVTAARAERSTELQGLSLAADQELEAGRPDLAARHLLKAVAMAPGEPELLDLQRRIAIQLRERKARVDQELHLLELLALAQDQAAADQHEEALRITEELLALDPDSTEGAMLRDQAIASLERERRAERERRQAQAAPQPAEAVESEPEVAAESVPVAVEEVEAAEGTAVVRFYTELPEGILTLYAGPTQVLRERFAFYERTGFLRNEPRSGRIDGRLVLASGPTTFRAYVARAGQPAQLAEVEGRVPGGGEVTLRIHLAADGSVRAWLEP